MPSSVSVRRVYDTVETTDGTRILVDGLWPRGIARSDWPGDSWRPDLAPSRELREWYGHEVSRFDEFTERYREELASNPNLTSVAQIQGPLTLVTATKDVDHSHARVLGDFLTELGPTATEPGN